MTPRLWFRLEEILPIAEHAMACPTHRLTVAQIHAAQPLRPALVWHRSNDGEHLLYSNGTPVWYDEDGSVHAAAARTWLPDSAHTSVEPWHQAHPGSRYLILDDLIDTLRAGNTSGGHWVVLDTNPQLAASPGRLTVRDHRDEITPAETNWIPATVTATALAQRSYPAMVAAGCSITGYDVIARFQRHTVETMIADLQVQIIDAMPGEFPVLRFDGDVLLVLWEQDDAITGPMLVEADRVYPDSEAMYAVGAYLWPWLKTNEH